MTANTAPQLQGAPEHNGSGAEEPAALEATGVTVRFGGLVALNDVGIKVPPATIVGLVGPNGAGKTTLFHVISGLLRPARGTVTLGGRDVTGSTPQRRARYGLARTFQQLELFTSLTVRDHIVLAFRVRHQRARLWRDLLDGRALRPPSRAERERVDQLITLLGLETVAKTPVAALPLGTSRRVEVVRALATSPSVLLLDEPSSGLDAHETHQLAAALRQVVADEGVSILLVEHDVAMVLGLSSRVSVLDFGVLIAEGTPDEVRKNPAVQAAYLGDQSAVEGGHAE
jgi:ABC-type branched-subunit amino acid transport system ATPase component